MNKEKKREIAFVAVSTIFTILALYGYLRNTIDIQIVGREIENIRSQCEEYSEQIEKLRVEYDNSLSLTELEEYASNKLGMRKCQSEQIIYLEIK